MTHIRRFLIMGLSLLLVAPSVLAQAEGTQTGITDTTFKYLGAAFGIAIAAAAAAYGDSRAISAACEGVARNPGAGGRIQTMMLIGVVFIETLVLITFGVIYVALVA
jgi:F-type H+-transporting ATPase subunit c